MKVYSDSESFLPMRSLSNCWPRHATATLPAKNDLFQRSLPDEWSFPERKFSNPKNHHEACQPMRAMYVPASDVTYFVEVPLTNFDCFPMQLQSPPYKFWLLPHATPRICFEENGVFCLRENPFQSCFSRSCKIPEQRFALHCTAKIRKRKDRKNIFAYFC